MFEIIGSSTTDDGNFSLMVDFFTCLICIRDEIPYTELFPWVLYINEMVSNCILYFFRCFSRTYVQMPVDLDGVCIDNRKPLRIEIQQKFCFSDPVGPKRKIM